MQHFERGPHVKSPITGAPLANQDLIDNHALKAMIRDWKPGRQSGPSELETREAGSIADRVKEEFRKNAALLNAANGRHIVAFLGNTGSGKSTLVNLLAGKKLIPSEDGEDYILADPQDPTAMVIGTTGNSETLYPKAIDVDGLRFFDLPGFNDTDGSERNLVNAAFTRKILLDAASVRLVFVVGQDQFTADRSASVKNMFQSIKQLFVADHGMSLIDNGVFVATKITCTDQTELTPFLLKKTDARDKEELNQQLQSWSKKNRISRMFHPIRETSNTEIREQLLGLIQETEPTKILGLNVSALYPPDTKGPLERLFFKVLEGVFERQLSAPLATLADYDHALTTYTSPSFWETFDDAVCLEEKAIGLLKEFCINPYIKALKNFEGEKEKRRQSHIQGLKAKKQEKIKDIGKRTELRAKQVIASFVPQQDPLEEENGFVFFDFAYHKDYYDQVCGTNFIDQLATDPIEQEIVRQQYVGFMARHSHEQMMRWQERFSGVEDLRQQLAETQQRLTILEEPFIKARKAEEEQQRQAQRVAEELEQRKQAQIEAEERRKKAAVEQRRREAEKLEKRRQAIPEIALGHEDVYERFLRGRLIYRPQEGSDVGQIELPIAALRNPLEGEFDLSKCGDAGQYLSINTGYRKGHRPENANKVEIWFTPRFLVDKEISQLAQNHYIKSIIGNWDAARAPIGIFWTWGGWNADNHLSYGDYLTKESMDELGSENLAKKYQKTARWMARAGQFPTRCSRHVFFTFRL